MTGAAVREKETRNAPRSGKGERTRERLLEAAKQVFEEQGFLNARIEDIALRAEQSHGTFYYYFDSKEEVFRALVAALDERLFAPLDDVILAESGLARGQRIREASRRYLEYYRGEARMLDLIEQVSRYDPEINALRLAHHKRNTERVTEAIRQMQLHGAADPDLDPMIAATALGALTQRFAELWFVHEAVHCTFERGVEQLSRIYENALRASVPKKR
jgi:AcrR family transcriptional regulator